MLLVVKNATRFVSTLVRHVLVFIWKGGVMKTRARTVLVLVLTRSATVLLSLLTTMSPNADMSLQAWAAAAA